MPTVKVEVVIERKSPQLPRYVVVPESRLAAWKLQKTTIVEGTINGEPLGRRGMKQWSERHAWFIELPTPLCKIVGVDTGDCVTLELKVASEELPKELTRLLAEDRKARQNWERHTESQRRMIREHIAAAKQPATRAQRAAAALR